MVVSGPEITCIDDVDVGGCESHRRRRGGSVGGGVVEGMGSDGATVLGDVTSGVIPKLVAGFPCEWRKADRPQQACQRGRWSGTTEAGCSKCVLE